MWWLKVVLSAATFACLFLATLTYRDLRRLLVSVAALALCALVGRILRELQPDLVVINQFLTSLDLGIGLAVLVGAVRANYLSNRWTKSLPEATTKTERAALWPAEAHVQAPSVLKTFVVTYVVMCVLSIGALAVIDGERWPMFAGGCISLAVVAYGFLATKRQMRQTAL